MEYIDKYKNKVVIDKEYDFTSETIGYKRSSILKNKFFNEETSAIEKHSIYCQFSNVDPDNYSILLQKVYKDRWDERYLKTCIKDEKENIYYSDVMTSLQGLLNSFYKKVCSKNLNKSLMIKIVKDMKKSPEEYKEFIEYFINNEKITNFIKCYHTIGNYIPVPRYFNTNRSGNYADHDMWDLTLIKIYDYYHKEKKSSVISDSDKVLMELLFSDKKFESVKNWLDSFGDWKPFIEENYLQDFVYKETGKIREEFINIHNWNKTYPETESSFLDYFELLTDTINKRSKRIINKEKEEIKDINSINKKIKA